MAHRGDSPHFSPGSREQAQDSCSKAPLWSEKCSNSLGEATVGCAVRTETAQHTEDSRCARRTLRSHAKEDPPEP
ncbi:MAG: hypothetical protein WBN36_04755, partial [Gammaproteobacteria bacterium]